MKRAFFPSLIVVSLFLISKYIAGLFYNYHDIKYDLTIKGQKYQINEIYEKNKYDKYYFIKLKYKDHLYHFDINDQFNHQKKIIKDIDKVEKDNIVCLQLKLIKNTDKNYISCYKGQEEISYAHLMGVIKYSDFEQFNNSERYVNSLFKENKDYYYRNIDKDEHIAIYKYNHIEVINYNGKTAYQFTDVGKEKNFNTKAVLIDKYYLSPVYNKLDLIDTYMVINLDNGRIDYYPFKESASDSLYIQGIVDKKLYMVNTTNYKQYVLDPYKGTFRPTHNTPMEALYYNGTSFEKRNINEFIVNKIIFANKKYRALKNQAYKYVSDNNRAYYYITDDNKYYMVYKKDIDHPILLYSNPNAKNSFISNGHIYFIEGNKLVKFDEYGYKNIMDNDDFNYNYKDIVKAYYKEFV